ncbi:hypothetical protein BKA69DRAFT_1027172, partial [Paraphysoderma sedebokerense]
DQSEYSAYAVHYALKNVLRKETDLVVLLNVRPQVTVPGTTYMDFTDYLAEIEAKNREKSHELLHLFGRQLKKEGISVKAIALRGDPRTEIMRKLNELKPDMLILGSRGLGAIKRMFLGSTRYSMFTCASLEYIQYSEKSTRK